jgi:flavin reductase (DIM6/NTAB) family NADH-FMN oxidoreductase RutF
VFKDEIERAMHELPYGLYIIGSREEDGEKVNGMMADWVMQVSFEPRMVAVAFEGDSHTLANVRARKFFTVNLLSQDEESMELARRFAQPYSGEKIKGREGPEATALHHKLDGLPYGVTENGCPVLEAAMAWFECQADELVPMGDHIVAVGLVLDGALVRDAEPLTSTYTGWTYSG